MGVALVGVAPFVQIGGVSRAMIIQRDLPDLRDLPFQPGPGDPPAELLPGRLPPVTDQDTQPFCVGHAPASAIHITLTRNGTQTEPISARML